MEFITNCLLFEGNYSDKIFGSITWGLMILAIAIDTAPLLIADNKRINR